jgi:cytochrome c oxidase assembly factor CtaG
MGFQFPGIVHHHHHRRRRHRRSGLSMRFMTKSYLGGNELNGWRERDRNKMWSVVVCACICSAVVMVVVASGNPFR